MKKFLLAAAAIIAANVMVNAQGKFETRLTQKVSFFVYKDSI